MMVISSFSSDVFSLKYVPTSLVIDLKFQSCLKRATASTWLVTGVVGYLVADVGTSWGTGWGGTCVRTRGVGGRCTARDCSPCRGSGAGPTSGTLRSPPRSEGVVVRCRVVRPRWGHPRRRPRPPLAPLAVTVVYIRLQIHSVYVLRW